MDSAPTERRFTTFAEFWPFYVQEHSRPATRWVHFLGSTLVVVVVIVAIVWQWWWLLMLSGQMGKEVERAKEHSGATRRT